MFFLFVFNNIYSKSRQEIVQALFRSVENWMGTEYKYGGESKAGVDCSAFVQKVYKQVFNIELPRGVRDQSKTGYIVKGKLQPGDLIFFYINGSLSHIGIYVFDNKFIHAASAGPSIGVVKSSLNEKYYKDRFAYAKRLIELPPYKAGNGKSESLSAKKSDSPVAQKNEKAGRAEMIFGNKLALGNITKVSEQFDRESNIYLQVKFNEENGEDYKVIFIDKNSNKVVKMKVINSEKNRNIYYLLNLNRGNYIVKLIKRENEIIDKKDIFVK